MRKRAWWLFLLVMYERFFGRPLPFPSVADVLYLAVFPVITTDRLRNLDRLKDQFIATVSHLGVGQA